MFRRKTAIIVFLLSFALFYSLSWEIRFFHRCVATNTSAKHTHIDSLKVHCSEKENLWKIFFSSRLHRVQKFLRSLCMYLDCTFWPKNVYQIHKMYIFIDLNLSRWRLIFFLSLLSLLSSSRVFVTVSVKRSHVWHKVISIGKRKKERTRKLASTSEACVLDVPFSKTFISLWPRLWRRKTIFVYVHILRHFAKTFLVDRKRIRELCTRTCSKQNANQSTQRSERGMKMVTDAIVVFFYFSRQPSKSSSTGQKPKNVESLKSSRIRTIESVARQIRFWNLKKRIDFSVHQLH